MKFMATLRRSISKDGWGRKSSIEDDSAAIIKHDKALDKALDKDLDSPVLSSSSTISEDSDDTFSESPNTNSSFKTQRAASISTERELNSTLGQLPRSSTLGGLTRAMSADPSSSSSSSTQRSRLYCEGFISMKSGKIMKWSKRYIVLRNRNLFVFHRKTTSMREQPINSYALKNVCIWPGKENGLVFTDVNGKQHFGLISDRRYFIRWVNAIHYFRMYFNNNVSSDCTSLARRKSDTCGQSQSRSSTISTSSPSVRRRVSFNGSVRVREIPFFTREEADKLFYTEQQLDSFAEDCESVSVRTEQAFSNACLWIKNHKPKVSLHLAQ